MPTAPAHGTGFGVYAHWPFCLAKCPYCDFNSHVSRSVDQEAWRKALVAEAAYMRALTGPRRVDTVFFGGGTPSLMPPRTVESVIKEIDTLWGLADAAEITLEANPTSVEASKFRAYADTGINRVSMGVQALNDADLKALGRMHSVAEARDAFDIARSVFDRVSFDLIYARMGQTLAEWEAELAEALAMAVDHLSLYQLTIEQGTRFGELHAMGRLRTPADDLSADMYDLTQQMTAAAGMPAYEISNHARAGAESRHNLIYWRGAEYAGIGPGAHGRISIDGQRHATETLHDPAAWLNAVGSHAHGIAALEPVAPAEQATEYLLMAMRLSTGAERAWFEKLGGQIEEGRRKDLIENGFLQNQTEYLAATQRGRIVLNSVLAALLT
ncbi:MAG: radical SAM family heme chaperone HemW [Pseudomonadota bacterium]